YLDKLKLADGVILASPVYFCSCTAQLKIFLERAGRVCQFSDFPLKDKIGAALVIQDQNGGSSVYAELVNWMLSNQMVVVGSNPTCIANNNKAGYLGYEKREDSVSVLRMIAKNMTRQLLRRNV
ncbi:MAG: flavodoxin family protein, partial [archaeon]|nr:flavodoxin family protein [archaeon]